jgi:DNA-binding transcriptional ArsR family regulator
MDTRKDSSADLAGLRSWTFITSHAQVLLAVARDPSLRVEEIAKAAQISERSAYRILADLQKAGYVQRRKNGRRNRYEINSDLPLEDPLVADEPLRELIALVSPGGTAPAALEDLAAALRSPLTSRRP